MRRIAESLNAGEVVLFPTDTVYGLLARADVPKAIDRIYELKGRDRSKPLVRLTDRLDPRDPVIMALPPRALRVVAALWPGPLTVVGGAEGLRWADHHDLNELLSMVQGKVVATSANLSGMPDPRSLAEVAPEIRSGVGAVHDGACGGDRASTVVRFTSDGFSILREGPVPEEALRYLWCTRVAFVCTGNTCRSPMAEGLARHLLELRLGTKDLSSKNLIVESAGVSAADGSGPSRHAVSAMKECGIDISGHASRNAVHLIHVPPDFLYGLTRGHVEHMRDLGLKAETLSPEGDDVTDPIGGGLETYRKCRDEIQAHLAKRVGSWQPRVS
ncbi:MAG: Sua5/YciO/YrdC/YwlC family protein [Planctomycetota bacterium]